MVEILVAMVLLAAVGATALSFFSSSTQIVRSSRATALNIARGYLEQLYEYVGRDKYAQSGIPLSLNGATLPSAGTQTLDGTVYTTTYTVNNGTATPLDQNGDGQEDYRRVNLTVSW